MREDQLEMLEKLFPDGFLMYYPNKDVDGHVKIAYLNKHKNRGLELMFLVVTLTLKNAGTKFDHPFLKDLGDEEK